MDPKHGPHKRQAKVKKPPGLPPGTLVYNGEPKTEPVTLSIMDYGPDKLTERSGVPVETCQKFSHTPHPTWIHVKGVHDTSAVEKLGQIFEIHPLILEDIVNTEQRPKFEIYESYLYCTLKLVSLDTDSRHISDEQISLVVGANYLISFQESTQDIFEPVKRRIEVPTSRLRQHGTDYLAYALIDILIDHGVNVIDEVGQQIESLEEMLIRSPSTEALQKINEFKRSIIFLRGHVRPYKEALSFMLQSETPLFGKRIKLYLRDVKDHVIQASEELDYYRELLAGLTDLCLSSLGHQMNQIMKFLTMVGTIFIPLTFVAGIYGMNFKFMPELDYRWGYPIALGTMVLMGLAFMFYFKRKNWW